MRKTSPKFKLEKGNNMEEIKRLRYSHTYSKKWLPFGHHEPTNLTLRMDGIIGNARDSGSLSVGVH